MMLIWPCWQMNSAGAIVRERKGGIAGYGETQDKGGFSWDIAATRVSEAGARF